MSGNKTGFLASLMGIFRPRSANADAVAPVAEPAAVEESTASGSWQPEPAVQEPPAAEEAAPAVEAAPAEEAAPAVELEGSADESEESADESDSPLL